MSGAQISKEMDSSVSFGALVPWGLTWSLLIISVLSFIALGIWSWSWNQDWLLNQLRIQSELVAGSVTGFLTSLGAGLPTLGEGLGDTPVEPTKAAFITLSSFVKSHPYISNLIVYSATGNMLLNTAVPYGVPLPNASPGHPYIRYLDKTLVKQGLQVALTSIGVFNSGWHLRIRYVARSAQGLPLGIIQANIPVDLLTGQWASMSLIPHTSIGLLRMDGHILARLPIPAHGDHIYTHRYDGGLVHALKRRAVQNQGSYIGQIQVDHRKRFGAYTRLFDLPVVAFVSLPYTYVRAIWIRQIGPALVVGLMALIGFIVILGRFVFRERAHARELVEERDQQAWIAMHDVLTRLPNRAALETRLEGAQARVDRNNTLLAIGIFDLDDFKKINDRYGHEAGDKVLQHLGALFIQNMRASDFVVRLGGDEFVLLFEDLPNMDMLNMILSRLEFELQKMAPISETASTGISGSLGLTIYPFDDARGDLLLRHADQALYQAKKQKQKRACFFTLYENQWVAEQPQAQTRSKLEQGCLVVYYQPVLDLKSRRIRSVEALARLRHPVSGNIISPAQFLSDLESVEEQLFLLHLVLCQVDRDAQAWDHAGCSALEISINLPPVFLAEQFAFNRLLVELETLELPSQRIIFEVLETKGDISLERGSWRMQELKSKGFKFALDDVGSAYSTLLRLKDLPVDRVKLDQDFVRKLSTNPGDLIFVEALHDIAEVMEIDFVAEGVETIAILDAMIALNIPKVQGDAIARPMPGDAIVNWICHYELPPEQPHTLLGLYASHRKRDYFVHGLLTMNRILLQSPKKLAELEDRDVWNLLRRLGHENTGLSTSYSRYREALKSVVESRAEDLGLIEVFRDVADEFGRLLEVAVRTKGDLS